MCECRINNEKKDMIDCKPRNWIQKIWDNLILIK